MKVLITGAAGFIGSHLVEDQLQKGREVVAMDLAVDNLSHLRGHKNCRLVQGDIRDEELLDRLVPGTDCLFHLASAHLEVNKPESYYWDVNVGALRNLLAISSRHQVKRFVHCSSVGVYGRISKLPADENTTCQPEILYEKTKLAGEKDVLAAYHQTGLPIVILRPAWVYGPRCPRTLKLFRTIKKGRFLMVGGGENFRHPLYVSDLLRAFELAAGEEAAIGEIFVIASSEPVSVRNLTSKIAKFQHASIPAVKLPLGLTRFLASVVESAFTASGKEPPFSSRSLKFFTDNAAFDISKAQKILNFSPSVELDDGLRAASEWYVNKGLL
jgi:nucleoside-diphosphate-sugar epimerase